MTNDIQTLVAHIDDLAQKQGRVVIGLCGPPGAGKSTLCDLLAEALGERCVVVPMDGFHLAKEVIEGTQLMVDRGVPDSFDGAGYVNAMKRIVAADETVYVPHFTRTIEDAIAGAIKVAPETPIVITEGNYLLYDQAPWDQVANLLDEVWYVSLVDDEERRRRLIARHEQFGQSPEEAIRRANDSDERNAVLVAQTQNRAHAKIGLNSEGDYFFASEPTRS